MQKVVSTPARARPGSAARISIVAARMRAETPSPLECGVALISAVLLVISFPDFNVWPLAWVSLVPLLFLVARRPHHWRSFYLGWLFGSLFFYGSCYWVTYSMIHTAGLSPWIAYPVLAPGAVLMGIFPGLFLLLLSRAIRRWGSAALFVAPVLWPALEWTRLEITGQLWNALGYSQAYQPWLIQGARWGGVYVVGALILLINASITYVLMKRSGRALIVSGVAILLIIVVLAATSMMALSAGESVTNRENEAWVVAVQPNVPMDLVKSEDEMAQLHLRHFEMSKNALRDHPRDGKPRLVIWPESPMNFTYGSDSKLREELSAFAIANETSVLFNSQEVAPNDGIYNSAILINQQGSVVAQYDKIRLLPFGEYVPLPRWVPGAGLITSMVGDFTPGTNYRLMPVGDVRAGVFICIESAYPMIARRFTNEGADVLINISNDGYLGPTAVMRQHLANAVFRAVENGRPLLRVTNTGITAFISPYGEVLQPTKGFVPDVRVWEISRAQTNATFYAKHGDLFAIACVVISLLIFVFSFRTPWNRGTRSASSESSNEL